MMPKNLYIAYSNSTDPLGTFTLQYKLRDTSIVPKWCQQVEQAQNNYSIDDPGRFYGFGPIQEQTKKAIEQINNCIKTINEFEPIVDRILKDINDQDTLNYLHHVFEVYHGLLDQQTHEFWLRAPIPITAMNSSPLIIPLIARPNAIRSAPKTTGAALGK